MRILFAGNGGSPGSWKIRGEQLARAMDAKYTLRATESDVGSAQAIVVVKRPDGATLNKLHRFNKRMIWDVVDAWPQPSGNEWNRARAVGWLRSQIRFLNPYAIVFPNTRMYEDSDWTGPHLILPHHSNPRYEQRSRKFNEQRVVGYEGAPQYLGRWRDAVAIECADRGWLFKETTDISEVDYVVALRDCTGYAPGRWKSNVKTANARALGCPVIASPELSYLEFTDCRELWVESASDLHTAFDQVARMEEKLAPTPLKIEEVAKTYRCWLSTLGI
jgi:hypothetical protein